MQIIPGKKEKMLEINSATQISKLIFVLTKFFLNKKLQCKYINNYNIYNYVDIKPFSMNPGDFIYTFDTFIVEFSKLVYLVIQIRSLNIYFLFFLNPHLYFSDLINLLFRK